MLRCAVPLVLLALVGCNVDDDGGWPDHDESVVAAKEMECPRLKRYAIRNGIDISSPEIAQYRRPWQEYLYDRSRRTGPEFNAEEKKEFANWIKR